MNTFYLKTFLRFCAITLVLALTSTAVYFAFFYENPHVFPHRLLFKSYASAAVSVYENGGKEAFSEWNMQLEEDRNIHMYLLNNAGQDVLDRTLPKYVKEALSERSLTQENTPPYFVGIAKKRQKYNLIFTPIVSQQGNHYLAITDLPPIKRTAVHAISTPQNLGLRLLTVIVIGGLITAWITWYLTRPVNKLRRATQEWSTGNLSARIGTNLGTRQDEIAALGRDLDHMAERLQNLMQNQQQLLSDISHELRTPLARLQIALGLARQRTNGMAEAELDRIEREAERLNDMIGQILSVVRLEAATQVENKEETDVVDLLNAITNNAQFENSSTQKTASIKITNAIPKIQANSQLIYSALENVIRNAFRYTPHNTNIEIQVKYLSSDKAIHITVRDQGPGVPEDKLNQIFEPFFRVAHARERDTGGYGLGLAIVKRAVELHGGKILAENASDGGLKIHVTLPIQ